MRAAGEWRRNVWRFLVQNQRLLWLLSLFLGGVQIGCTVFRSAWKPLGTALSGLLSPTLPSAGLAGAVQLLIASCAPTFLLLLLLFFLGFSACGAPPALMVPVFFGAGLGLSEAYYFALGARGVGYVVLLLLPPTLVSATALLMACAESMRLSSKLCRQLLPHPTIGGNLWPELKLYLARFLLCAGLLFLAGVLDTVLRICFIHHFV